MTAALWPVRNAPNGEAPVLGPAASVRSASPFVSYPRSSADP
jgi:hypothetical protein